MRSCDWVLIILSYIALNVMGCGEDDADQSSDNETNVVMPGIDPFCLTRPKIEFCEDFDTEDLPGAFSEQRSDSSSMLLDSDSASSLPRSLLITVESGGHGELRHSFESGGKLRLFGMLYVPELGEGEVKIGAFELGTYRVGFGVSEDGSIWAYEGDQRIEGDGSLPVGGWASFRWDVNIYEDGTGTANLRFGIDTIVDINLSAPMGSDDAPAVIIGLSEATGAWTMRFDTLTVAVEERTQ